MSVMARGLAVALVACLVTGCGGGEGGSTDPFADLPGVRDAAIRKEALDTDYYGYTAVVDMEEGASVAEIAAALDGLATWSKGRGGGDDGVRLYLDGGTTTVADGWGDGAHHEGPTAVIATAGSHARNVANAELLLHATEVLDAPVTITDYEWAVTTQDPVAMLERVVADPELATSPGMRLAIPHEEMAGDYWDRPAEFASAEGLKRYHLPAYRKALANAGLVRDGRAHVEFVGSDTRSTPTLTDRHPGAIEVRMALRLPGMAGPEELVPEPTADPRWPVVAAQLDLLRTLPAGSRLAVNLEWGRSPDGGARRYRWLVDVGVGQKKVRAVKGAWQDAAFEYLNR